MCIYTHTHAYIYGSAIVSVAMYCCEILPSIATETNVKCKQTPH